MSEYLYIGKLNHRIIYTESTEGEGGMKDTGYLYSDLTEMIIGFAFDIFKQIGPRLPEKVYQKAMEVKLTNGGIGFLRENYFKIVVDGRRVGSFKLDFLIEDKLVLELKVRDYLTDNDIAQVLTYLKAKNLRLGLILLFTRSRVKVKRVIL